MTDDVLAKLAALSKAAPGVYFTSDDESSPYCAQIVRVFGNADGVADGVKHWAEGYTIVTEEPVGDDHPDERAYLVAAANAAPLLLAVAAAARECRRVQRGIAAGSSFAPGTLHYVETALDAALAALEKTA